jgi:Cysteine-rich secretory protein family
MSFSSIYGEMVGLLQGQPGKTFSLAVIVVITATWARADDMAEMISRYRREHGLSSVKTDPQLTAIAERQAKAMAASGIMDHSVAGSFSSRVSSVNTNRAAENIAAGTKTWADTLRMWQNSPGHNANLLQAKADSVGVAVARNENTRYKIFWAMVIAEKAPKEKEIRIATQTKAKEPKVAAQKKTAERRESAESSESPLSVVKNFVCKYLCQ